MVSVNTGANTFSVERHKRRDKFTSMHRLLFSRRRHREVFYDRAMGCSRALWPSWETLCEREYDTTPWLPKWMAGDAPMMVGGGVASDAYLPSGDWNTYPELKWMLR